MEERKIVDYFVVAGLPSELELCDDIGKDGAHLKSSPNKAPITDITVIFPSFGEQPPDGYTVIQTTPSGHSANLNFGSIRAPEVYICYKRGRNKPPLVDIGVMYEGKEKLLNDSKLVDKTPDGRCANVNNSTAKTFLTYRRAPPTMPCNALVVTDIAVIIPSKGEKAPQAFCMINKTLNKGLLGLSDVFLCYKKSMNRTNLIAYKPGILLRYPFQDKENLPLPESVPMFCLPMGCSLERWPVIAQQPEPIFSTFVLTVSDASEKLYGSAVTFYEPYPVEHLTEEQKAQLDADDAQPIKDQEFTYNVNKCICLLSRWPFFDVSETFLCFIHRLSCTPGRHPVPIERFVTYLMEDVPFPTSQKSQIWVQLSLTDRLILTQPENLPLPRSGSAFRQLLVNLGPDKCLLLLLCALTEQKILVHSLRPDILTLVAEAVSMLMFPFKWQCPYIPLCPLGLAEVLHAPLPFLIGVDSRFFDLYDPPCDVNCVDLDTSKITICEEKKFLNMKLLPKKAGRVLKMTLDGIYKNLQVLVEHTKNNDSGLATTESDIDKEFQLKKREQLLELEIQEAFLKFMATILRGYRNYLRPITQAPTVGTTDTSSLFDLQEFLRSRDKQNQKFFSLVTKTQMFIRFIEERSFVSDMDAGLAFFDECSEKVDDEGSTSHHLLDVFESLQSERTVCIMPPEHSGQFYEYDGFNLDPKLFGNSEDIKGFPSESGKNKSLSGRLSSSGNVPGSPMARRTKREIQLAQKLAQDMASQPLLWAKCLLGACYSIWFIHLPSYTQSSQNPRSIIQYAYDLLVRLNKSQLPLTDEVCYRVMMQLCGLYSRPVVAVKLLSHMKRLRLQPNAITYGFYNRAVLEATWPSGMSNSSQLLWNKLRNVVVGAALFRRAGLTAGKRRFSNATDDSLSLMDPTMNCGSHTSIDSADGYGIKTHILDKTESFPEFTEDFKQGLSEASREKEDEIDSESDYRMRSEGFATFDKFRTRLGSIVRPSGLPFVQPDPFKQQPFESSAGLLMTPSEIFVRDEKLDVDQLEANASANSSVVNPPHTRRYRSGSCTEFTHPGAVLTHLRHTPTSPKPTNDHSYQILTRSESFASDAGILANLHAAKEIVQSNELLKSNKAKQNVGKFGHSKSLFGRRGSLNLSRVTETPSLENIGSSNETIGSSDSGGDGPCQSVESLPHPKRKGHGQTNGSRLSKPMRRSNSSDGKETRERPSRSPVISPSRTPVTENDPLGALVIPEDDQEEEEQKKVVSRVPSEIELDQLGGPVLFERRTGDWNSVVRSATFTNEDGESEDECEVNGVTPLDQKPIHRSSTMPVDVDNSSQSGTFGSLSSSFKLPFTRYSPARFSLRKAADIKINTQSITDAITSLSPGSLTSKKSNDLLMGGLSSLKSAASSVAKKFDEIKEAISANSTPVKGSSLRGAYDKDYAFEDDTDFFDDVGMKRKISSEINPVMTHIDSWGNNLMELLSEGSRKGSSFNLGEAAPWSSQILPMFSKSMRDITQPVAVQILMTTCSKCHNCSSILYDEEIMAGWAPEDSNLNTKCPFCDKATVPLLSVTVIDFRTSPMPPVSQESTRERKVSTISIGTSRSNILDLPPDHSNNSDPKQTEPKTCEPITVPYLNPLVLRKEFESILSSEGDSCLNQPKFVDDHPIIYWNTVWTFTRIGVESHMTGLVLGSACVEANPHPSWSSVNSSNILISTVWHNPRLHEEVGQPMYLSWNDEKQHSSSLISALVTDQTTVPKIVLQKVLSCLQCSDLTEPLKCLALERQKLKGRGHSLYREILFLAITALGRENIDQGAFDREYQLAFERIPSKDPKLYLRCDNPPSVASLCCRQHFRPLEL